MREYDVSVEIYHISKMRRLWFMCTGFCSTFQLALQMRANDVNKVAQIPFNMLHLSISKFHHRHT